MIPKFLFDFLSVKKKYSVLWNNGLLIGTRDELGQAVHLYMVGGFFAEVVYKEGAMDDVRWVKSFAQLDNDKMNSFRVKGGIA